MFDALKDGLKSREFVQFYVRVRSGMAQTIAKEVLDDESIKIHVAAIARNGRANAELIRYIAGEFGVHRDNVHMLSGASSRVKLLRVYR